MIQLSFHAISKVSSYLVEDKHSLVWLIFLDWPLQLLRHPEEPVGAQTHLRKERVVEKWFPALLLSFLWIRALLSKGLSQKFQGLTGGLILFYHEPSGKPKEKQNPFSENRNPSFLTHMRTSIMTSTFLQV